MRIKIGTADLECLIQQLNEHVTIFRATGGTASFGDERWTQRLEKVVIPSLRKQWLKMKERDAKEAQYLLNGTEETGTKGPRKKEK